MTSDAGIYEKAIWPCFTPDLFWALQDEVRNIGQLVHVADDAAEYEILTDELPEGEYALWHFNALRDIRLGLRSWPLQLRKRIDEATLCLGDRALQTVRLDSPEDDIQFDMFSGASILPLFVVDDDTLTVRIQFKQGMTDSECHMVPKQGVHATGLLTRIKERQKAFFVAASSQSVLTWDGSQNHVFSKAIHGWGQSSGDQEGDRKSGQEDGREGDSRGPRRLPRHGMFDDALSATSATTDESPVTERDAERIANGPPGLLRLWSELPSDDVDSATANATWIPWRVRLEAADTAHDGSPGAPPSPPR